MTIEDRKTLSDDDISTVSVRQSARRATAAMKDADQGDVDGTDTGDVDGTDAGDATDRADRGDRTDATDRGDQSDRADTGDRG